MESQYKFPGCGCCFDVHGEKDGKPILDFNPDVNVISLDCPRTWSLLSSGKTKGVFQLESRLGQSLAAKLKPENIEQLSALVSIMRPGCSESMRKDGDGPEKSITQHYIDRRHGREAVTYYHPDLEASLCATYGEMVYQEQAMRIARDIAGFDLQQADVLRKAIGKKKPEIMAKVKKEFIEGCKKTGIVTDEEAAVIFSWIEKSQRYSFNKSHAITYAINGYLSAFAKAHFPRAFYCSYLFYSQTKQKPQVEIRELISDARGFNIKVLGPDFRNNNKHFKIIDGNIYFGAVDIKGLGDSMFSKMSDRIVAVEKLLGKKRGEWTWLEFLLYLSPRISKTYVEALIKSGALSYMGESRTKMLFEYKVYSEINKNEQPKLERLLLLCDYRDDGSILSHRYPVKNLKEVLHLITSQGSGKTAICSNVKRLEKIHTLIYTLEHPPHSLQDDIRWIANIETALLGIPLSCTAVQGCEDADKANCTVKQFIDGFFADSIRIACEIDSVRKVKTKKGKNPGQDMAFLQVSDITGVLESVVLFPEYWKEFEHLAIESNTIMLTGIRGKDGAFQADSVTQL